MTDYVAPLRDTRFVLNEIIDMGAITDLDCFEAATPDVVDAVLEEAAKLASGVMGPLNTVGDDIGRPLASNMAATASAFVASAPRPYTVSVGKAANPPLRRIWAASVRLAGVGATMFPASAPPASRAVRPSFPAEFIAAV